MKNKILSIISLLLIAAMLLVSCSDPTDEYGPDINPPEGGNPAVAEAFAKWSQYVSYKAPEAQTAYKVSPMLSELESKGNIYGNILVIADTADVFVEADVDPDAIVDPGAEPEMIKTETVTTTKWYDINTGALVQTFVQRIPEVVGGKVDESINLLDARKYVINYADRVGLIAVYTETSKLIEPEIDPDTDEPVELDIYDVNSYELTGSYSYYDFDGKQFVSGLKQPLKSRYDVSESASNAGRWLIDSEELDKTFLVEGGKLVREFGYQMEYDIPVYDEEAINYGGEGYAYFEYKGNKYIINEEAHSMMPVGDIYLVLVPGISITVTDANDNAIVSYSSECYAICGYAVLSNGNIYLCEYELLNKDAAEYDIKSGEEKLNINHKIISAADGSVSTLDLSYKAGKIYNDNTSAIRTFTSFVTMEVADLGDIDSALLNSVDVTDGYMIAEIQKYADGTLDSNSVFAVLNESLEIVAELPKLIANQFTYPSFVDSDTMVVSTRTAHNSVVYYGVETDGEIFILPALNELTNIEPIKNGYVWWDGEYCKVYDKDWKLLKDYGDISVTDNFFRNGFGVINGALYFNYCRESGDSYVSDVMKVVIREVEDYDNPGEVFDYGYNVNTKLELYETQLVTSAEINTGIGFLATDPVARVSGVTYYNIDGEELFTVGTNVRDKALYDEDSETYVDYDGTATIYEFIPTDAGYIVSLKVEWERWGSSSSELPEGFTEYEYFIIK